MSVPHATFGDSKPPGLANLESGLGDVLADMSLFSCLEDGERDALFGAATVHAFSKGEAIFDTAESGALMILLDGWAALSADEDGRRAVLALIQAPDALNLACVMAPPCLEMTWRAAGPCTVAFLPPQCFREVVARNPRMAGRVAEALAQAYRHSITTAAAQRLHNAARRLADYLLILAPADGRAVPLPHAKRLLASLLGMTPENLSRAFASLARHGVSIHGARVAVQDRQRLRAAVEQRAAPEI